MTHTEALKTALKALELEDMACRYEKEPTPEHIAKAIAAIKEALARPEYRAVKTYHEGKPVYVTQQEPVAWKETDEVECPVCKDKGFPWPKCGHITYLEPAPPQRTWVGLTDEEAVECWPGLAMYADCAKFWKNIEAKLKDKNEH